MGEATSGKREVERDIREKMRSNEMVNCLLVLKQVKTTKDPCEIFVGLKCILSFIMLMLRCNILHGNIGERL